MQKKGKRELAAKHTAVRIALGSLLSLGLTMLLLLAGAAAVSRGLLGQDQQAQIAGAGCLIGCFLGALSVCGRLNSKRFPGGVVTGGGCFLLILLAGLLSEQPMEFGSQGTAELLCCLIGGALAGLLTARKKTGANPMPGKRRGAR